MCPIIYLYIFKMNGFHKKVGRLQTVSAATILYRCTHFTLDYRRSMLCNLFVSPLTSRKLQTCISNYQVNDTSLALCSVGLYFSIYLYMSDYTDKIENKSLFVLATLIFWKRRKKLMRQEHF